MTSSLKIYCPECDQQLQNTHYCHPCQRTHFQEDFENWTSGDEKIDQYIRETQLSAKECTEYIEWIPFSAFINISKYEHAELGTIFTGNWEKGPADTWDPIEERFVRSRELTKVTLILLGNDPNEILKELNLQYKGRKNNGLIMRLFGMTKELVTGNYMIVAETVEWDLRHYVSHHFVRLTWHQKLAILHTVAVELANLRANKKEFSKKAGSYCDNVVRPHIEVQVKELGLGDCNDFIPVIGYYQYDILPFFAPEVLLDIEAKQTSRAEVYMFGMLMWEFATNRPPFYDVPRDSSLLAAITSGKRPKIPYGMPECYARLMQDCWQTEPLFRLDIYEISRILGEWHLYNTEKDAFARAERQRYREVKARGLNPDGKMLTPPKVHPQAIYTSRLLRFSVMPKHREITRLKTASYLERQEQRELECLFVKDESFFMSRTLVQKRNGFPEIEPEPEDDDLLRQCNELSIDCDDFFKYNQMLVEVN